MIPKASDIVNFIEGNANYYSSTLPKYKEEQVELRRFLCSDCDSNGKCLVCGCKTPNMYYATHKVDSKGRWAEFMSEAQWNSLVNNIDKYSEFIKTLNKPKDV